MCALQRARLKDSQFLPSSAGSIYTNPSGTKTWIRGFTIHNTNSASELVEIWNVVNSGGSLGTPSDVHKKLELPIPSKDTFDWILPHPIVLTAENDAIFAKAASANKVTIEVLGDKE